MREREMSDLLLLLFVMNMKEEESWKKDEHRGLFVCGE